MFDWSYHRFLASLLDRSGECILYLGPPDNRHEWHILATPLFLCEPTEEVCSICIEPLVPEEADDDPFWQHGAEGRTLLTVCGHVRTILPRARARNAHELPQSQCNAM
jgi:hypothetical protein